MPRAVCVLTTDLGGNQHRLANPTPPVFSSHIPGGFATCAFSVRRPLGRVYPLGVGLFWRCEIWEGVSQAWDGEIRDVQQSQGDTEVWDVTAYGPGVLLKDAPYNRVWRETRYTSWVMEKPTGHKGFEYDQENRIHFRALLGAVHYTGGDSASFRFGLPPVAHHPDAILKVTAMLDFNLGPPNGDLGKWQLMCYALDDAGASIITENNPTLIESSGKSASKGWSWTTTQESSPMPADTRGLRFALESAASQVQLPGHLHGEP